MIYCRYPICVLATMAIMSCGSNSSPTASDNPTASEEPAASDEEMLINEPAPTVNQISPLNARQLAIDVIEVGDIVEFAGSVLPNAASQLTQENGICNTQGSYTVSQSQANTTVQFSNCDIFAENNSTMAGTLTMSVMSGDIPSGEFIATMSYQDFTATRDNRVVRINGELAVTNNTTKTTLSASELNLNDSQGDIIISELSAELTGNTGAFTERSLEHTGTFLRYSESPITNAASFIGGNAACPTSGLLTSTASDNSSLTITASGGDNLMVTSGINSETLNCVEIAKIID